MAKKVKIAVTGIKEIDKHLKKMGKTAGEKVLRKVSREELKPVAEKIKNNFPVDTGETKKQIKVRAGKRRRTGFTLEITAKYKGSDGRGYIANFLEGGVVREDGSWKIEPQFNFKKAFEATGTPTKEAIKEKGKEALLKAINSKTPKKK